MGIKKNIKILIIDNDELTRMHLRVLLDGTPEFEVIDEAEDGKTALELTQQLLPDIVVMNAHLPVTDGFEATKWITSTLPYTKVIAFTSSDDEIKKMIDCGASGILRKNCRDKEIVSTVKSVSQKIGLQQQKNKQSSGW